MVKNNKNIFEGMTQYQMLQKINGMNRKQKRELAKQLHMSFSELQELTKFSIVDINVQELPEGTLVKLKVDEILKKENELSPKYIEWVKANKDKVFTCERDPELPNDTTRVVLKEDENNPKWLFHTSDLELVIDDDIVFAQR